MTLITLSYYKGTFRLMSNFSCYVPYFDWDRLYVFWQANLSIPAVKLTLSINIKQTFKNHDDFVS